MPFRIGAPELILVLSIILLVFGVGRLPQVAGAIGRSIREFPKAASGENGSKLAKHRVRGGKHQSAFRR
jgi:sec-independent protein translocase protein TatA